MPGLKQTIIQDGPVAFWSFDEDRTGFEGNKILDEINNLNPLVINGLKYNIEQLSLNDLEVSNQHSIKIAKDGGSDTNWTNYNTFFECVHSTAFDFTTAFTIEFLYYKDRPGNIRANSSMPGWAHNIYSPIIYKAGLIDCRVVDYWTGSNDKFYASILGRTVECKQTSHSVFSQTNHVVITYNVVQTDVNEYTSTISLYINGRLRDSDSKNHIDSTPNVAVPGSWFLAGTSGSSITDDFNTELLALDQFAVYNKALTESQISNHYRKSKHYENIIKFDGPQHYWRFDEIVNPLDSTIYADVGGVNGKYYGSVNNHQVGPGKLVESRAAKFSNNASGVLDSFGGVGQANIIISINQNYTLEFWFNSSDGKKGVLFSCLQENPDWNGLVVWLNSKDNMLSPGNIQVSESITQFVNSRDTNPVSGERENWNDGAWHHVIIRRTASNSLQLIIDGEVNNQGLLYPRLYNARPSQIHVMGMAPGQQGIIGQLSEMAFYQYAISDIQILHRWLFTTRYQINGYTLLQGQPVAATVRFYDHTSGKLVHETQTNSVTGEYVYQPATNRFVDILSFIPDNKTTRYRAHGPVLPAEFQDNHLL